MKQLGKWVLGAAVMAGTFGLGSTAAHAAQVGVYVGGDAAAYVPPCPGPGYEWVAGYYSGGYWMPGRWNYVGAGYGYYDRGRENYRVYDRDGDRDRWRDRDRDRWQDRGRDWDRGRDYDRERHFDRDGYRDRR